MLHDLTLTNLCKLCIEYLRKPNYDVYFNVWQLVFTPVQPNNGY